MDTNKPTSSEEEPFDKWLHTEVCAIVELLKERGNLPAQGGYILAVSLAAVLTQNARTGNDNKLTLPLIQIGSSLRSQAMQQWVTAQIVN
jgi:hypothetical protein